MGVLNVTPDSFSDGSVLLSNTDFMSRAIQMIDDGADILDVGGESTRPKADLVSAEIEIKRVCSFLETFRASYPNFPISLDTKKIQVAKAAQDYNIQYINDVSFLEDVKLLEYAKKHNKKYILMHARGNSQNMMTLTDYQPNLIQGIDQELQKKLNQISELGLNANDVILDLGFGFAKTKKQCVSLIENLKYWTERYPQKWLFGISRKSFLTEYLGDVEPLQRDDLSANLAKKAVEAGFELIRTHNVSLTKTILQNEERA